MTAWTIPDGAPPVSLHDVESLVGRLVAVGVRSDHVAELLFSLWSVVRRPMAVVDPQGSPLATAPVGVLGRQALAEALGEGEGALDDQAPAGWKVLPLRLDRDPLGFLVVLADPVLDAGEEALVEAARSLVADQLRRASLAALVLDERRNALKRRLVTDGQLTPQKVGGESERAQMPLADHYWPAIVCWERGEIEPSLLSSIEDLVRRHAREDLTIRHDARAVVLLVAQDRAGTDHELEVQLLLEQVVESARARLHGAGFRGILAKASVPLADVAVEVEALRRLGHYLERRHAAAGRRVHSERSFAFLELLEAIDRRHVAAFVTSQIGPLLTYDRAHGANLAGVLEIALDVPNREQAARAAYMHRNTFRRHLRRAQELIDADLADPDERLAVHVALRLSRSGAGCTESLDGPC